jgi:hypothetical protein
MDLIERYLGAIAGHLPADKADDIVAELRDVLLSRVEEQEAALGRSLEPKEVEAMLKAFGPPLRVAARYWPTRYLIGPDVFPYWWACLKTVLLIESAVFVSLCFADLLFAAGPSGRIVGQAISAVWTSAWATTGAVTVFFAILERMGPRARYRIDWNLPALPRFRETEQSRWNRVSQITGSAVLLLWCVGILKIRLPYGWSVSLTLHPTGLWADIYWPVIGLLCAGIATDLLALIRPDLYVPRALAFLATRAGWLALAVFVWRLTPSLSLAASTLPPAKLAHLGVALDWTIRIAILGIAVALFFEAAREGWRLVRRLGRGSGERAGAVLG